MNLSRRKFILSIIAAVGGLLGYHAARSGKRQPANSGSAPANAPFSQPRASYRRPVIKVMGVGFGGGNTVWHMVKNQVDGVDFICADTVMQALATFFYRGAAHPLQDTVQFLQMGAGVTKGLGAGANSELGRLAAMESRDEIAEALSGAEMVLIVAGMGGGTGTGAAPVVAEVAKSLGLTTIAVVTKPFEFEGRDKAAEDGITELLRHVDSLFTIPNEKLLQMLSADVSLVDAFEASNEVVLEAVKGLTDPTLPMDIDLACWSAVACRGHQNLVTFGGVHVAAYQKLEKYLEKQRSQHRHQYRPLKRKLDRGALPHSSLEWQLGRNGRPRPSKWGTSKFAIISILLLWHQL